MAHDLLTFRSDRTPVLARGGMVCTSQPLAAAAGVRMLDAGGNAADAAVAAAAALAVVEPCSTGIGGDCFALFYDAATGEVSALNGSGRAPAALDLERVERDGLGDGLPPHHAHTVTVPGACAGWADSLERHGRLPLARVLEPARALAEEGFPVSPVIAVQWAALAQSQLGNSPGGAELLVDGRAPRAGEIFRNPGMARTLRALADAGPRGFYEGEAGAAIARAVQQHGGALSEADLSAHRSTWEEPISSVYWDLRVWECPPNGRGAPVAELLSESYAAERRKGIDPTRANPDAKRGVPVAGSDTVYLCAADADGNACSFINSNYMGFGTGIVPDGFGFSLQNRGFGFSLDSGHPNALAPGKRPYHTIIPGMLTRESDGSLYGPFGVMGGYMQPQGHVQVVVALADDGADPQRALDRPRFCIDSGSADGAVSLEAGLPDATLAELGARGHDVSRIEGYGRIRFGKGQVIRRDPTGVLWGGSDPRADGCALPRA